MKIHVPSMLAKGRLTNKHNKQAATMAYKIHKTQRLENIKAATLT